jgi:glyoxylase-like metal-dependent hydrolase (beta-lactamase superfamily II)
MKLIKIAAVAGAAMLVAAAANAQGVDFSKVEITTVDLGNNTYMLVGQGGNITVAVGTDGIIMVDSQYAPLYDKVKTAIAKISPLPIKYLINTHYHRDHVDGNELFKRPARPWWDTTISGSGSPPAPPTSSTETRRRRHRRAPSRP